MNSWFDWRRPGGGITFLAACFILGGSFLTAFGEDVSRIRWYGPVLVVLGTGLWLKHSWARWLSFALMIVIAIGAIGLAVRDGVDFRRGIQLAAIASMLYSLWDWDVRFTPTDDPYADEQL